MAYAAHIPKYKKEQLLRHAGEPGKQRYLAFPALLELSDRKVLIVYKDGERHYKDREAALAAMTFDPAREQVEAVRAIDDAPGIVNQSGELVRMPGGDLCVYIDRQASGASERLGLHVYRSSDEGASFREEGPFPPVGGIGFGYAFDEAVSGADGAVYLLNMSFPELAGGVRAVHALRSEDEGRTWTYVANLNEAFGFDFNESSMVPYRGGFLLIARGYDNSTRLYRTGPNFQPLEERNLSAQYEAIDAVGRPRLFVEDERYYLLCRNVKADKGTLALYRFDPDSLELRAHLTLDASESFFGDSYYAEYYFQERGDRRLFNVITYKPIVDGERPSIVRLEFDWAEVHEILNTM